MTGNVEIPVVDPRAARPVARDELLAMKREFLASLNHEIRTPLSGILGMTDLLMETRLDEEQQEYLGAVRLCAENLLEMLNASLEYSALSAGQLTLEDSEFHLPDTLESAVNEHRRKAEAKGIALECTIDPSVPQVASGDAMRLKQVLSHLIDNAVKFTSRGRVWVSASAAAGGVGLLQLQVEVEDSGIGIAPDKLNQIFEAFHQLDAGLGRCHPGLGLGLAIVQKLVQLMKGDLTVTSELGRGSVFRLRLPLRCQEEARPEVAAAPGAGRRILVVEDNSVARIFVRHVLGRAGYEVHCADGGQNAIDMAAGTPYELILMDLQMPNVDGLSATAAIRRLPGYEGVPVIAFTANATPEYRSLCYRHGMQGFVPKPVEPRALLAAVSQHLNDPQPRRC